MQINPQDIRVDTFNIGSSWIPKFNGVVVTHTPTGITAKCGDHVGQHMNKFRALELLKVELNLQTTFTKQVEMDF